MCELFWRWVKFREVAFGSTAGLWRARVGLGWAADLGQGRDRGAWLGAAGTVQFLGEDVCHLHLHLGSFTLRRN